MKAGTAWASVVSSRRLGCPVRKDFRLYFRCVPSLVQQGGGSARAFVVRTLSIPAIWSRPPKLCLQQQALRPIPVPGLSSPGGSPERPDQVAVIGKEAAFAEDSFVGSTDDLKMLR